MKRLPMIAHGSNALSAEHAVALFTQAHISDVTLMVTFFVSGLLLPTLINSPFRMFCYPV